MPKPGTTFSSDEPKPSRLGGSIRKILILLVLLAAVGGAIWKIRENRAETAATPTGRAAMGGGPTPVLVTPVVQRTVPVYLTALGTVTAYNSVTIKSRVDGQLLSVNVREGQTVKKGQLLAQIDPRPYQAAVAQAEGQLTKDQATAVNAQAEAGRYTALYGAGVISKESQQLQVSNAGVATGAIQADQAAIEAAKVNVIYTRITSPIDGVVGLRTVDPGNIVHASDSNGLILVNQVQPIAIIFTLPEDQLPQVLKLTRGGATLAVEAYDRSETTHLASGTLLTVDNTIDTTTGTAKIKAVFPNADGSLFPNQFVNVRLIVQDRENAIVVPSAALQTAANGNFLYVVKPGNPPEGLDTTVAGTAPPKSGRSGKGGGKGAKSGDPNAAANGKQNGPSYYVEAVPVKVDLTQGSNVILAAGTVNPGDQIVIDGQEKLKNGGRVIPHQSDPTIAPPPSTGNGHTRVRKADTGDASGPQGTPASGQNGNGTPAPGRSPQ
ncbi:putative Co/Zn/Cd efflux system membrane fusion protein [Granulicella sibirica]|uniref:Putative Co/Zn/Cd efflux system membrane fusion protein n=1 Tax=Granulicella sibirica TaxID=2479048 RepID=A0A4V1L6C5_9BACT|nr:putative Co/Zn/Cd efflux system membrane fusion protein [Granulicella sibirica]